MDNDFNFGAFVNFKANAWVKISLSNLFHRKQIKNPNKTLGIFWMYILKVCLNASLLL